MKKDELQNILNQKGINKDSFCLDGGNPTEKYVLSQESSHWSVYYSERGLRTEEKIFSTEEEACEYFLSIILEDPTTKIQ